MLITPKSHIVIPILPMIQVLATAPDPPSTTSRNPENLYVQGRRCFLIIFRILGAVLGFKVCSSSPGVGVSV